MVVTAGSGEAPAEPPATRAPLVKRRPWAWLLGTVALSALIAAGLIAWSVIPRLPADDSVEAGFARDMITHHEQAVEMALLVRDRSTDPLIRTLSTDILLTQTNQMGQMMGWLDVWGLPLTGPERPMAWMGHGGQPMPGMASSEEIAELTSLSGTDAEVLFLQLMIRHHLGGIPMAQEILARSDNPMTERLATSIVNAQQSEIDIMIDLLAERNAEPLS
jgi:uncharacterized protein (DUF305 family)